MDRISWMTARGGAVLLAVLLGTLGATDAVAEDDELAVDRALRRVLRSSVPLVERLEAARTALDGWQAADGETLTTAGLALLEDAPEPGGWLLLRGRSIAWPDARLREHAAEHIDRLMARPGAVAERRAAWAAAGFVLGHRPDAAGECLVASWPPSAFVAAVLRRDLPPDEDGAHPLDADDAEVVGRALAAGLGTLRALDQAESEDPAVFHAGLDALLAPGADALPTLLAEAGRAAEGVPAGYLPRVTRAILALGLLGRREATPLLVRCLEAPSGWVRVAAATALGDLGDPAAAIALCRKVTYRGDVLRPQDQWDFPGERETTVTREAWTGVQYYVADGAAADALLRLGAPGAAEWIVRNQLDPGKSNFRIRVFQDAVDALRRALPAAPVAAYNVDAGVPARLAAFEGLLTWWEEHAFDQDLVHRPLDAGDEGFRREARRMVERLRGRSVMELQIAQETCAILGSSVTPVLLETLSVTKNRVLRTEIARALGVVRDLRAVDPLLDLTRDRAAFLRAVAAESLGAYLERDARVEPALVRLLDDPEVAPRVAALSRLAALEPTPERRAVFEAHTPESIGQRFGTDDRDYRIAWTVGMFVQEGEVHWPTIRKGLASGERYVRRSWWDILRRSIGLPNHVYDAITDPSTPSWQAVDEARVLAAVRARRAP